MNKKIFNKVLSSLRDKKAIEEIEENNPEIITEEINAAKLVYEAEEFVKKYIEEHGTKAFISERLRDGYIGELRKTENGAVSIQAVRGIPYGTIVAVPTKDNIRIGVSFMGPNESIKGHPIVGLYYALKRAIEDVERTDLERNKAAAQTEHFRKRALAYFHPEVYSYSRGTNPVKYEDYDEIHKRRDLILGLK